MKSAIHPTIGSGNFDDSWKNKLSEQRIINKSRKKTAWSLNENDIIEVKRDAQGVIDFDYYAHEASDLRADAFREFYSIITQWFVQIGKNHKG